MDNLAAALPAYFIVQRARSMIGTRYDFWRWNCQDLVYWALGLQPQSPQRAAVAGVLAIAALGFMMKITTKSS